MSQHDLEFSISQYLDGTLGEAERAALEARLARDVQARALLDEHRRLDALLKRSPLPSIRWEALAQHISSAVAEADEAMIEQSARSYRMPWVATVGGRLALAASVLIASGLGAAILLHEHGKGGAAHLGAGVEQVAIQQGPSSIEVSGPTAEASGGPGEAEISVGPSKAAAGEPMLTRYSDEVVTRPSHIMVASGANPVQDSDALSTELQ